MCVSCVQIIKSVLNSLLNFNHSGREISTTNIYIPIDIEYYTEYRLYIVWYCVLYIVRLSRLRHQLRHNG